MTFRVVVTGMYGITPLGNGWSQNLEKLKKLESGIRLQEEWKSFEGIRSHLGGEVVDFTVPKTYPRKKIRSSGRVAALSIAATEKALQDAGLIDAPELINGSTGVSYGSSSGSPPAYQKYVTALMKKKVVGVTSTTYIKMMSHTCAANLGLFFETKGRIISTCTACTSGSQGIGYAYESIKYGQQKIMLAGGAEELHISINMVFDIMFATSTKHDQPHLTPRPFDKDRDGLVVGEGAATLILEEYEHAKARGATMYAEVVGFGTNTDGAHITNPSVEGMAKVMKMALQDANLSTRDIGYISAHGTATSIGDIAESKATLEVFGSKTPISSLKGYMGHTLGASGAIEAWLGIEMMHNKWFAPTKNLTNPDPDCASLNYIMGQGQDIDTKYIISNNFAFGGVNTSLILQRLDKT